MRLHYLQHVPFEDLANIEVWAKEKGHNISRTLLFKDETLPEVDDFDWLIVMGGPMNIYEEQEYPWLVEEKGFVLKAIENDKIVLGICLGAQLIAGVLGGTVYRNDYKEIGWFPVSLTQEAEQSPVFSKLPDKFAAFHWHGDTFDLPAGCVKMAESEGCSNQAFEYNGRVIGLQFHLESSTDSIQRLIQNCGDELVEGKYIQGSEEILSQRDGLHEINGLIIAFLNNIEGVFGTNSSMPGRD